MPAKVVYRNDRDAGKTFAAASVHWSCVKKALRASVPDFGSMSVGYICRHEVVNGSARQETLWHSKHTSDPRKLNDARKESQGKTRLMASSKIAFGKTYSPPIND
jgi:hypothetical protein